MTLHEGKGFSLPPGAEAHFSGGAQHHQGSLSQGGGFSVAGSMRPGSSARNQAAGSFSNRPQSAAGSINAVPTIHGRYSSKHLPYALVDFDKQQVFINAVSGTPENPLWGGESTQYKFDVSRVTELQVSLYIRNPTASPNAGRSEDIFIGKLSINPRFEEIHTSEVKAKRETGSGQIGADWTDVQFGSGSMKVGVNFVENRQERLAFEDFELLKVVGKGSFGKVFQVMYVSSLRAFGLITFGLHITGRRTLIVSTLSSRSARHTSFPAPKWRTRSLSDQYWRKLTTHSLFHSNSLSRSPRSFT